MVIREKRGNLADIEICGRTIDRFPMQWYETEKRILTRTTTGGRDITIRFLGENPCWTHGDILYVDELVIVGIDIMSCEAIRICPQNLLQMAAICYEIGNKHLPLFFDEGAVLTPFENPLFRWLSDKGFKTEKVSTRLLLPLRTTVVPHGGSSGDSLFSKVLKFTQKASGDN